MRKVITLLLSLALVLSMSTMTAFASDISIIGNASDYYQKTTHVYNSNDLGEIGDAKIAEQIRQMEISNDMELVGATVQEVYAVETLDKNGNLMSSRLMNYAEVAEYKNKLAAKSRSSAMASSAIGSDTERYLKLTIYLTVYKTTDNNYAAYGSGDWDNTSAGTGGAQWPADGLDFIALTWGGGGELKTISKGTSGYYQYSQGNISFSRANSDSYAGYCWQFQDTKRVGLTKYYADIINGHAKIGKTYSTVRNKETNVKFTYIHTYQSTTGSISISGGTSGAAASVSLSSTPKKWQIEIDVPGVKY